MAGFIWANVQAAAKDTDTFTAAFVLGVYDQGDWPADVAKPQIKPAKINLSLFGRLADGLGVFGAVGALDALGDVERTAVGVVDVVGDQD